MLGMRSCAEQEISLEIYHPALKQDWHSYCQTHDHPKLPTREINGGHPPTFHLNDIERIEYDIRQAFLFRLLNVYEVDYQHLHTHKYNLLSE